MNKTRLEAFSDGVIAILITIMVLELKIPHTNTFEALWEIHSVFGAYILSFVFVGIYWNNHHHLLHVAERVTGKILWANMHFLLWLSLIPFVTNWLGENRFTEVPTAAYGAVMLMTAVGYTILQNMLASHHGPKSQLALAVGADVRGRLSIILYLIAIPMAFVYLIAADIIYIVVSLMWLIPDARIESMIAKMRD